MFTKKFLLHLASDSFPFTSHSGLSNLSWTIFEFHFHLKVSHTTIDFLSHLLTLFTYAPTGNRFSLSYDEIFFPFNLCAEEIQFFFLSQYEEKS